MVFIGPNESQAAAKSIGNKRPEQIHQKTSRGRTTHSITQTQNTSIDWDNQSGVFVDTINNNTEKESDGDEQDKGIYIIQRKVQINAVGTDLHINITFFTIKTQF